LYSPTLSKSLLPCFSTFFQALCNHLHMHNFKLLLLKLTLWSFPISICSLTTLTIQLLNFILNTCLRRHYNNTTLTSCKTPTQFVGTKTTKMFLFYLFQEFLTPLYSNNLMTNSFFNMFVIQVAWTKPGGRASWSF
jgi:hypothetical protein